MRRIQFRAWLPVVFGLASIALMVRGIYVERLCFLYDAGRPFWPCEAPDFAVRLLSAPAVVAGQLLANLWNTAPFYFRNVVELPLILLWWWFVGTRADLGLLGVRRYKRRRAWLGVLIAGCLASLAFVAWSIREDIRFYRTYSSPDANPIVEALLNLRSLPVRLWLLILVVCFGLAAWRIARGQTGQTDRRLTSPRVLRLCGIGFGLYCVCAAGAVWHTKLVEQRREAEYDLHRIILKGRVLDDRGAPVFAIEVDLVPVFEKGEAPHWVADPDFTDQKGEYTLSPEQAGKYLLAVQWNAPPSPGHPFLTRYYPDATDSKHAETLEIAPAQHMELNPIRLQRLEQARVPVSVAWSDGKPEPEAYFLFMNTQFPEYGVVGRESLHPSADGTVSLPAGYEYRATAQVECDGGEKIVSAYTPGVVFSLKSNGAQAEPLHLVLPGSPCRVWHPQ